MKLPRPDETWVNDDNTVNSSRSEFLGGISKGLKIPSDDILCFLFFIYNPPNIKHAIYRS